MRVGRMMGVVFGSMLAWSCSNGDSESTSSSGGGGTGGNSTGGGGGNGGTGGATGSSTAGAGGGTAGSGGIGGGMAGNGGAGGGAGGTGGATERCAGLPSIDDDLDGYAEAQGDCDDCNAEVNPDAAEVIGPAGTDPIDEDCDNAIDTLDPDLLPCDAGLALASEDPLDAVKAIGFCDHAKFLKKANWVLADGLPIGPPVSMAKYHLGHGLLDHFGTNDVPREGQSMLMLSSGTARNKDQPGFVSRNFDKGYSSNPPLTFTGETSACPGIVVAKSSVQDAAGLELEITAPSNANGVSFRFNFRSYDFPSFVCTAFGDAFWANFVQGNVQKNIAFDSAGDPIGSSSKFITQCECPPAGPGVCTSSPFPAPGQPQISFDCQGVTLLEGTDFDGNTNAQPTYAGWSNGGTEWLVTSVPVAPKQVFKLRFVVFDAGVGQNGVKDHNVDSAVLIDKLRWHTELLDNETLVE